MSDIPLPDQPGIPDTNERRQALDPGESFIVQAPAGSGKTSLLTQRFLRLLATVANPEEVVAITFTRKAASEMQGRIAEALRRADDPEPDEAHEQVTWRLARRARDQDQKQGWDLANHPSRLRILTFDAYCMALVRQMPFLAQYGSKPAIAEDQRALYQEAARRTLALVENGDEDGELVARLLAHLDNDHARIENMIVGQLEKREQWLPHLVTSAQDPDRARQVLETSLRNVVADTLGDTRVTLPPAKRTDLMRVARLAGEQVQSRDPGHPIAQLADAGDDLPGSDPDALPLWMGLAELVTTRDGGVRKRLNQNQGFPPQSAGSGKEEKERLKANKDEATAVLEDLGETAQEFVARLAEVRDLPPTEYQDEQWTLLEAIARVLPLAAAQLDLLFREQGVMDFNGVAIAAQDALGAPDAPSDLALALDYRVSHILVDEFQDTSTLQMQLLRRLTEGWTPEEGRTLFAVGDPMQSIYGFRDARVGLFLEAWANGIGPVQLTPLQLTANFRSKPGVVDWVNKSFPHVMPAEQDTEQGAVPYSPGEAIHASEPGEGVTVHPFLVRQDGAEADKVADLIQQAGAGQPGASVAVLVRSRNHLTPLIPRLRQAGVPFEAVEIERLGHRPVVQDLLALTRALAHPGDRAAWLSVLRAPWGGLGLTDLGVVTGEDQESTVLERMRLDDVRKRLSEPGLKRLIELDAILRPATIRRNHGKVAWRVEGVWRELGGPACVERPEDMEDARTFFDHLAELEEGGSLGDLYGLIQAIESLFAQPDRGGEGAVQLLTMHKAKGLEFDTVILPALGNPPGGGDDKPLVQYMERPRHGGAVDLILAPIQAAGEEKDPIYRYVEKVGKAKSAYENGRLLYVAATRSKKNLHILGAAGWKYNDQEEPVLNSPPSQSLLATLWPVVEPGYQVLFDSTPESGLPTTEQAEEPESEAATQSLHRLPEGWAPPEPPRDITPRIIEPDEEPKDTVETPEEFRASATTRHVGTLVHRLLRVVAIQGPDQWSPALVDDRRDWIAMELTNLGVPDPDLEEATERVIEGIQEALREETGRWILDAGHAEVACERRVSGWAQGGWVNAVVDRTFVAEDGTRWIVDYKTGTHEGGDIEAFLNHQAQLNREQLERYAELFQQMEDRPTRIALYFPLLGRCVDWSPEAPML